MTGMLFDGRYRIEAKLAAGGFGAIYRTTYLPTGACVALKVLHPDLAIDATLSARFRREAAVLASLRDPHTIETYEYGETTDGTSYIAMELLTGRTLQAELQEQGALPWWRTLAIMRGVCSSLIEAHSLGLVHRDLKPANIHLEQRGDEADFVKVLDFGIVKLLGGAAIEDELDITRVGQAVGTLDYMSPEQITGGETDHRTDIYTLGVVAYEMLTGRRPFADATTPTSLLTALMTRTPVAPSTLFHKDCFPAAVDRLLLRCLELDPAARFASVSELVEAIDEILKYASSPTFSGRTTLPGSGPFMPPRPVGAPAAALHAADARPSASRASSRPSGARSVPPMLAAFDDGDVTNVDAVPLFDMPWEPALDRSSERLARTPHLDTPPEPPTFKAARGSTVSVSPVKLIASRKRLAVLKLGAWAAALLASGVGLGMLVASL